MSYYLSLYLPLDGASPEQIQHSVKSFQNRWNDVHVMLDDRKRKLDQAVRHQAFETELKQLQKAIEPIKQWLDEDLESVTEDLQRIKMQLDQCRVSHSKELPRVAEKVL